MTTRQFRLKGRSCLHTRPSSLRSEFTPIFPPLLPFHLPIPIAWGHMPAWPLPPHPKPTTSILHQTPILPTRMQIRHPQPHSPLVIRPTGTAQDSKDLNHPLIPDPPIIGLPPNTNFQRRVVGKVQRRLYQPNQSDSFLARTNPLTPLKNLYLRRRERGEEIDIPSTENKSETN